MRMKSKKVAEESERESRKVIDIEFLKRNSWATAALLPRWFYYMIFFFLSLLCSQEGFSDKRAAPPTPHCPLLATKPADGRAGLRAAPPVAKIWPWPENYWGKSAIHHRLFNEASSLRRSPSDRRKYDTFLSSSRAPVEGNEAEGWEITQGHAQSSDGLHEAVSGVKKKKEDRKEKKNPHIQVLGNHFTREITDRCFYSPETGIQPDILCFCSDRNRQ